METLALSSIVKIFRFYMFFNKDRPFAFSFFAPTGDLQQIRLLHQSQKPTSGRGESGGGGGGAPMVALESFSSR